MVCLLKIQMAVLQSFLISFPSSLLHYNQFSIFSTFLEGQGWGRGQVGAWGGGQGRVGVGQGAGQGWGGVGQGRSQGGQGQGGGAGQGGRAGWGGRVGGQGWGRAGARVGAGWGRAGPRGGGGEVGPGGVPHPCDLSHHTFLILPLCCPSCK